MTAPGWGPSIAAGVLGAATYIAADISLRVGNGVRYGGELDAKRLVTIPEPNLFSDNGGLPNINPKVPNWIKGAIVVGGAAMAGAQMMENAPTANLNSTSQVGITPSPSNSPGVYTNAPTTQSGSLKLQNTSGGTTGGSTSNGNTNPKKK